MGAPCDNTAIIDVGDDQMNDKERDGTYYGIIMQNAMPPWPLAVCQDVTMYDIGVKICRGEFNRLLKEI